MNRCSYVTLAVLVSITSLTGAEDFNRTKLPISPAPFQGKMGLKASESVKEFPAEVKAPEDAPNVLLILTDAVGFGGMCQRL